MIQKDKWVILPASAVSDLPGLRISPLGCVPQIDSRPRWICDYSWSEVNRKKLPLAADEAMQFGHALNHILRKILLANLELGLVYIMQVDIADSFYRIGLNIEDIPRLVVVFTTAPGEYPIIAFPLVLPTGWKDIPPILCTATETITDLDNKAL